MGQRGAGIAQHVAGQDQCRPQARHGERLVDQRDRERSLEGATPVPGKQAAADKDRPHLEPAEQGPGDIKAAVAVGEADIDQGDIRAVPGRRLQRFPRIGGAGDNLMPHFAQKFFFGGRYQQIVLHEQNTQRKWIVPFGSGLATSNGRSHGLASHFRC
ncbi:protein of unknown function [Rhodovastum atsumiense]|nr:protein of unknown function [Rhodovastum atsumiense]